MENSLYLSGYTYLALLYHQELPKTSLSNRFDDFFMGFVESSVIIWNWLAWSVFLIEVYKYTCTIELKTLC